MARSTLSVFLAVSLFIWAGCYETVTLTRDEYSHVSRYDHVNVLLDSAGTIWKYSFSRGMCTVQHDTLVGTGIRTSVYGVVGEANVVIPTSKIGVIEVKRLNYFVTLLLSGAVIGLTVAAVLASGSPTSSGPSSSPASNPH